MMNLKNKYAKWKKSDKKKKKKEHTLYDTVDLIFWKMQANL